FPGGSPAPARAGRDNAALREPPAREPAPQEQKDDGLPSWLRLPSFGPLFSSPSSEPEQPKQEEATPRNNRSRNTRREDGARPSDARRDDGAQSETERPVRRRQAARPPKTEEGTKPPNETAPVNTQSVNPPARTEQNSATPNETPRVRQSK